MKKKVITRHKPQQYLMDLKRQFFAGEISPAEMTTLCLLPEILGNASQLQRSELLKDENSSPIIKFLQNYSWKGHTDRIRRALMRWHRGDYPLVLWEKIPTALELLKCQAEGKRIITVFTNELEWQQTHLGKTAWDFIVHDLIHADHFFENSEWREGQIQFYRFIISKWDHEMIQKAREHCAEQFDYLISDMNSHPQHMKQTLSAVCLQAWKRSLCLDWQTRLTLDEEAKFQSQMSLLL